MTRVDQDHRTAEGSGDAGKGELGGNGGSPDGGGGGLDEIATVLFLFHGT